MSKKEDTIRLIFPDGTKDYIELNDENPVSVQLFHMDTATERECALMLIQSALDYLANLETEDADELLAEFSLTLDEDEITVEFDDDGNERKYFGPSRE